MNVKIDGKEIIIKNGTVSDALKLANINPETVLVKRGKTLIPYDEVLEDGDSIELITVISGG